MTIYAKRAIFIIRWSGPFCWAGVFGIRHQTANDALPKSRAACETFDQHSTTSTLRHPETSTWQ